MSAWRTSPGRSRVFEWQIGDRAARRSAAPAPSAGRRCSTGRSRPRACRRDPRRCPCSSVMQPYGVHGRSVGRFSTRRPMLYGWKPSTSFSGSMRSVTSSLSMCFGSGSWTRMPLTAGSRVQRDRSARAARPAQSWPEDRGRTSACRWPRSSGACCARRPATPDCRRRARPRGRAPTFRPPRARRPGQPTSAASRAARALPSMIRAVMGVSGARVAQGFLDGCEVRGFYPNA